METKRFNNPDEVIFVSVNSNDQMKLKDDFDIELLLSHKKKEIEQLVQKIIKKTS